MESTRLQKIERLLQKELSDIFQKQTQGMHGVLVSVSVVRVSPDLSVARAYLSIFPSDKSQELLEAIRSNTKAIRFDLGQRIRLQVRKIPELSFFIDDSLDYIENIDNLCISNQRSLESSFYIARRYLFSKKSHNAINIISMVSVCGVVSPRSP